MISALNNHTLFFLFSYEVGTSCGTFFKQFLFELFELIEWSLCLLLMKELAGSVNCVSTRVHLLFLFLLGLDTVLLDVDFNGQR